MSFSRRYKEPLLVLAVVSLCRKHALHCGPSRVFYSYRDLDNRLSTLPLPLALPSGARAGALLAAASRLALRIAERAYDPTRRAMVKAATGAVSRL